MAGGKLLVYFLRRDLRVSDNPILHHLASATDHGFTHLLPVYVFPAHQIEVSGFLEHGKKSPFPPARSQVGNFWRCGHHRAKFIAQSVWDVKSNLEEINSGLMIRAGQPTEVLKELIKSFDGRDQKVTGVWMTEEKSHEEWEEQKSLEEVCSSHGVDFKLWLDEKYLIDDRDTGLQSPKDLPDVFTSYRKSQEPLRERPRQAMPKPKKNTLPPLPDHIPPPGSPFTMPDSLGEIESCLLAPLDSIIKDPPKFPDSATSAHPFRGGETQAQQRLTHLIKTGGMSRYKETRNGLIGSDFSTKLSAFLALGCVTARQVHEELLKLEDGTQDAYKGSQGFGKGENEGTKAVRFELLWRDYMRLCTYKFAANLFSLSGFRQDKSYDKKWKSSNASSAQPDQDPSPEKVAQMVERLLSGTTGMGLIDASQRELYHTGYTSNRARQNVASFLAKHLGIDWRYGAEWYEMYLIDYDVSSNWANWQYVAGVGNDPRGDARIFNPVKQAFDYDKEGQYVRNWVPEVQNLEKCENVFQVCTASREDLDKNGLADNIMVTDPLKRIDFTVDKKPKGNRRPHARRRGNGNGRGGGGGRGRGGHNGGNNNNNQSPGENNQQPNGHGGAQSNNFNGVPNGQTSQSQNFQQGGGYNRGSQRRNYSSGGRGGGYEYGGYSPRWQRGGGYSGGRGQPYQPNGGFHGQQIGGDGGGYNGSYMGNGPQQHYMQQQATYNTGYYG